MSDKNGRDFNFTEATYEDFLERFKTIEERVAYLEELDKKTEFDRKRFEVESRNRWKQIENNLAHITKLTGIVFEELDFQNEKLETAGKALSRRKK